METESWQEKTRKCKNRVQQIISLHNRIESNESIEPQWLYQLKGLKKNGNNNTKSLLRIQEINIIQMNDTHALIFTKSNYLRHTHVESWKNIYIHIFISMFHLHTLYMYSVAHKQLINTKN